MVKRLSPPGTLTTRSIASARCSTSLAQTMQLRLDYRLTRGQAAKLPLLPASFRQPGKDDRGLPPPRVLDPEEDADADKDGWRGEVARPRRERPLAERCRQPRRLPARGAALERWTGRSGSATATSCSCGSAPARGPAARRVVRWSRPWPCGRTASRAAGGPPSCRTSSLAGRALQMLVSVEKQPEAEEVPAQVRPDELWLEVRPAAGKRQAGRHLGRVAGLPRPGLGRRFARLARRRRAAAAGVVARSGHATADRAAAGGADFKDLVRAARRLRARRREGYGSTASRSSGAGWRAARPARAALVPGRPGQPRRGPAGLGSPRRRRGLAGRSTATTSRRAATSACSGPASGEEEDEVRQSALADAVCEVRLVGPGAFKKEAGETAS